MSAGQMQERILVCCLRYVTTASQLRNNEEFTRQSRLQYYVSRAVWKWAINGKLDQ